MTNDEAVVDEATEMTTVEVVANDAVMTDNENELGRRKKKKGGGNNKKEGKGKAEPTRAEDPTQVIRARFAACGRCCYFLGSYTSAHGFGELETAVQSGLSNWLTLTWDQHTRNLVHKAFGVQLDVDYYFYEGCCVVCSRQFSLRTDETEGAVFRVQL